MRKKSSPERHATTHVTRYDMTMEGKCTLPLPVKVGSAGAGRVPELHPETSHPYSRRRHKTRNGAADSAGHSSKGSRCDEALVAVSRREPVLSQVDASSRNGADRYSADHRRTTRKRTCDGADNDDRCKTAV